MGVINVNFTPRPEELQSASQVIFKEVFKEPKWEGYDVRTGVTHGGQILLADGLGVTGKALPDGQCAPADVGDIQLSEKPINPVLIAGRFKYCAANQNQLLKILKRSQRVFTDFFKRNPENSEMAMISGLIMETLRISGIAKAWFSDVNAKTVDNGGVFTNGTDLGLFDQFNGFWKQIFGSSEVKHVAVAKNGGANYGAQVLTPTEAYEIVKAVYEAAPLSLQMRGGEIKVSNSIARGLQMYYAEKAANSGGLTKAIIDGVERLAFLGVPIVVEESWDYVVNKYQNDGTKWFKPHRVVYTYPENLIIGTINQNDLSVFRYIFDEVNLKNYIDYGYTMDTVIAIEGDVVAAY